MSQDPLKPPQFDMERHDDSVVLWEDDDWVFCRAWRPDADGNRQPVLVVRTAPAHPPRAALDRLAHEYELREGLDREWAVRPLELLREAGRTTLVLEDPSGEPLVRLLGVPLELNCFLDLAISITATLGNIHRNGLVHKDVKPAHILVNCPDGQVRFTGFGLASRHPRERQASEPPEFIAGTLPYMAPEQTGRMNRSIDSRSDLYSLGVTFYEMLTGTLPFAASDPMEWIHCHIARKPISPREKAEGIPEPISRIVMKLLAKAAEDRYQTAAGVEHDLRRCLVEWSSRRRIAPFVLAEQDTPDRLLIPEKLYGRGAEIEALLAAFDRVVKSGAPRLVLVAGYSGIGKSSVVHELHKALVPSRGVFASGKFDQFKRDIPYSTLVQAFQGVVRPLLGQSDAELANWRNALLDALGPNGRLMIDLIPDLGLIIGEQPAVPELPPQQAQTRFQLAFRRFVGVFARQHHPLVIFLDDLQWFDAATLDVLEHLLAEADLQLLLIGAYRSNEVDSSHPLKRKLDSINSTGKNIEEIALPPLSPEHVEQLIADAFRCEPKRAAPLARLVHQKTVGNPFFVIQFVSALAAEKLLSFDHSAARWTWDLERIHAKGYTDNVVDLMVGKLTRLPAATQNALQQLACFGNTAETSELSIVFGTSEARVHALLWPAIHQGLVERHAHTTYSFIHDRIQEAAYLLVPEVSRAPAHLRIGRMLAAHTPAESRRAAIFNIVNQLDRGLSLITSSKEREQLAEFNLIAGQRAKASAAYASALTYLIAGIALLANDSWQNQRELTFALELNRSECEFLIGELDVAEERLSALSKRTMHAVEQASVACLRVDLYLTRGHNARAVAVGLEYLRCVGIEWSPRPTQEEAQSEYQLMWSKIADGQIEKIADLPLMKDETCLAILAVLTRILPPAAFTDANLPTLVICRAVNLSLDHGNSDASCAHYAWLNRVLGGRFGDYQAAYRFGQLACDLVDRRGLVRFQAPVYLAVGSTVIPWIRHIRAGRDLITRAFKAATEVGDLVYEAYSLAHLTSSMISAGDPLKDVQSEIARNLATVRKMKFRFAADIIGLQLGFVRTMRGLTRTFGCFDGHEIDELAVEWSLEQGPEVAALGAIYWTRKLQARFFAGDYVAAINARSKAEPLIWTVPTEGSTADFHFYGALAHSCHCDGAVASEEQEHRGIIDAHHKQLLAWVTNCPQNFEHRAALVAAEIARLDNRDVEAMRLYEHSIRSAAADGFLHHEAIACELAGRFYAARGYERIAKTYLRDARHNYLRWGADGKVRQLGELFPYLNEEDDARALSGTSIGAPVENLDLATVIKVSQAVSGEIILQRLIDRLMRTAIEQAGAERGLLILLRGNEPRIEAEATTGSQALVVHMHEQSVTAAALPESVLHYVMRTGENVILENAAVQSSFANDPYIREHGSRSVLCLPLITQSKLIGLLYLENNLAPGIFALARSSVLKLLASQAAIALENSRLYRDVQERETKIRRLVDANIIGIFIFSDEGEIIEANHAFLEIVGYDREDLVAGRVRWNELTPPDWKARTARAETEMRMTGAVQAFEKEYIRKDGTRVPVLIGAAGFDVRQDQGVAFVVDLTERKRAEAEARESERRYRETLIELAHANRVTTMGQLTASIAHEVNQPIGAVVSNAEAGLNWLDAQPPNLQRVRQTFGRILSDAVRAGEIIDRIRALIRNAPPQKSPLAINDVVLEVVALTRAEVMNNSVSVQTELAGALPLIRADRVQLQQVIINLIINAVEAMSGAQEEARELVISTARSGSTGILVSLQDSGPGFDSNSVERLFEVFYTTKAQGMGMGLAICRSIIEAHGGRMWASAKETRGAVFQFTLPVEPDDTDPALQTDGIPAA
ncbi:trifunctional serine/threonine-protein kinase/ATP-binding protein/sensor histidine kinase [Bradyrhizobium sp. CCGUVB23]|uniref:trifunctional serine/threonine-protein kinase/ATP-binding protein/sensor histidine kinase n=1 Tax=Bradyrhizobium sp. CCGUVB23 TaxID=2949630 RepID=UPI0020B4285D|nr:trifunctional serine/threonine-protein kinase/ATP-binding protein/sensor histidine kinase [Bradyrhizobium sp. CCGUVB23]MCP3460618.1 AAA family ATPase [Bradyrhizobium sp. CCGUVB23]